MSEGIKLTSSQIQLLHDNSGYDGGFELGGEVLEGFEEWYIYADHTTGSYDSAKSAMVDFDIFLYDYDDNLMGVANGGYYCQGDYSFNYDLEFVLDEKEEEPSLIPISNSEREMVSAMIDFIQDMPTSMEPIQMRMGMEDDETDEFYEMLGALKQKL